MSDKTSRYITALGFALGTALLAGSPGAQANPTVRSWTIPAVEGDPLPTPLPMMMLRTAHSSSMLAATAAPPNANVDSGLKYSTTLHLDKTSGALHPVLTIKNTSSSVLNYTRGGLGCAWQILDKSGTILYDSTKGKLIPHFMMVRHLEPGQTDTYTGVIALKDNSGRPLPAGRYTLRAKPWTSLTVSAETTFTVTGADQSAKHGASRHKPHSRTLAKLTY